MGVRKQVREVLKEKPAGYACDMSRPAPFTVNPRYPIDNTIAAVREAVRPYPSAALFTLAEEGYKTLFEVLVGCIVSIRTLEEDTFAVSRRLFAVARTPEALLTLPDDELLALLSGSSFPEPKVKQLKGIARRAIEEFGGELPADYETILDLPGVGPKCANLALGIAAGKAVHVPVDIHVQRVTNRWGYVAAATPEKTMAALDTVLPPQYRTEINRLLVPFGKYVCTGTLPHCSTCPARPYCARIGVTRSR